MQNTQLRRMLKDLISVEAVDSKTISSGKVFYRLNWERDDPLFDPEHERIIRRYIELESAKKLAIEYGRRLGIGTDDVTAELERIMEERVGSERFEAWKRILPWPRWKRTD